MKRTISAMVGKGSVNHNSRKFHAKNTDPERSDRNIEYCNDDIRDVYHELFDEALSKYNEKQTRNDRIIDNYYEKICSGKQEKPFHEIILQIGNRDNCNATSEEGIIAAKILDEYMKGFQQRNPSLRVFSAHLHMDEATPHLHIDFIPFTTGSKRGLDTRVSLKKALGDMGFKGGTRSETELNQWVTAEKQQLAQVMERYDLEWEQKGTHEKHLSVLDFEKKERAKEVQELESQKERLEERNAALEKDSEKMLDELAGMQEDLATTLAERDSLEEDAEKMRLKVRTEENKWSKLKLDINQAQRYTSEYLRNPDEWLPEPNTFESAKSYKARMLPHLKKILDMFARLYRTYSDLKNRYDRVFQRNNELEVRVERAHDLRKQAENDNLMLREKLTDLYRVRRVLGDDTVDEAILRARNMEKLEEIQRKQNKRRYMRDAR